MPFDELCGERGQRVCDELRAHHAAEVGVMRDLYTASGHS